MTCCFGIWMTVWLTELLNITLFNGQCDEEAITFAWVPWLNVDFERLNKGCGSAVNNSNGEVWMK